MLVLLGIAYLGWLLILYLLQDRMLFPRWLANPRYAPPPAGVEVWRERADGGSAEAWFVPARAATSPAPTIVLFHGNAMLVQDWLGWADELSTGGWNVVLPEFRGYGRCEGAPTRAALVQDATEVLGRLVKDPRVDAARIVLYGRSIGGAIAAEAAVASAARPAAIIVHTTPARVADFAWKYGAPPFLVRPRFDAEAALATLRESGCGITVIGHRNDEIVPASHTRRLAVASGVTAIEVDGNHNEYGSAEAERVAEDAIAFVLARVRGS